MHLRALAASLLALSLLAGCGSSSDSGSGSKTTTVVRTVTEPPRTVTSTTPTETTPKSTEPKAVPTEPPGRTIRLTTFRSPSGNIGCVLLGGEARCDIRDRAWSPPPRPASCRLDYGQGLVVGRGGPGRFVCAGDTALDPSAKPLPYDTGARAGGFLCVSRTNGIRCQSPSGHGFFLSRQREERF